MEKKDISFNRKEIEFLQAIKNNNFDYYESDPFLFSTSVYGIIGFKIGSDYYKLTNFVESIKYFGEQEDVAIYKFSKCNSNDIVSAVEDTKMVIHPVDQTIKNIKLINETQKLFSNEVLQYEMVVTRGIIFILEDDSEISFEKNIWFSEDISIMRGNNLLATYTPTSEFVENWDGEYVAKCDRHVIIL